MEEKQSEEENKLLRQKVSELNGQIEWLKQELKKYEELRRKKEVRTEEFKKKLGKVR